MQAAEPVTRSLLHKNIHIPAMQLGLTGELIHQAEEQAVLIEVVVHDIFSEIEMNLIVY